MSSTAEVYPELYKACLQDWFSHSQEQDLTVEVLPFITPVKSMHYPNTCDVSCSNYAQDKLTHIAVVAFDRNRV